MVVGKKSIGDSLLQMSEITLISLSEEKFLGLGALKGHNVLPYVVPFLLYPYFVWYKGPKQLRRIPQWAVLSSCRRLLSGLES